MNRLHSIFLWPAFASTLLAGCASADADRFPSLALRDAERMTGQFTPTRPTEPPPPPVVSAVDLASIVENARAIHRNFLSEAPPALRLARSASGRDTINDQRSRALVAMAGLTTLHSQTVLALADLDKLEAEAATSFAATAEIQEAQSQVAALVAEQDETLAQVSGALVP